MLTRDVFKAERSRSDMLSGFRSIKRIIWRFKNFHYARVDVAESLAPILKNFCRALHVCHLLEAKTTLNTSKDQVEGDKICDSITQKRLTGRT
jgi:hypothetical protein